MIKLLLRTLLISIIFSPVSVECEAKAKAASLTVDINKKYSKWLDLSIDDLVKRGREFLYVKNCPDSALVCFSIASSRYNESLPLEDKEAIYNAYIGKWYAQFFHYYDYPKAYESLIEADKISEETGKGKGMANFNLALMYQMFSLDSRDKEVKQKTDSYLKKSFKEAISEKDTNVLHLAFSNMISLKTDKAELKGIKPYVKEYEVFNNGNKDPMTQFNMLLYSINLAIANQHYEEALKLLDRQLSFIRQDQPRYLISNLMTRAEIDKQKKEYTSAENSLYKAEKLAREGQMKDVLLNVYDALYKLYKQKGDDFKSLESYHKYLSMKDTLLNYRQIAGFSQIHFLSEMEKMDDTLAQIEYKRQIQQWIIILCIIVCISLAGLLFVILKKNLKLRSTNLSLYEKNKELMDKEDMVIINKEEKPKNVDKKSPHTVSNSLPQEKRDYLLSRIKEAAGSSNDIYSPKFTISKLSEITEIPAKLVSQVINDGTGDNFNSFINRYRIKKACHMLDDIDKYGNYTIENIGMNVGFRSRTAFISSFKKITGLTPSDYLRAAKQARASHASSS